MGSYLIVTLFNSNNVLIICCSDISSIFEISDRKLWSNTIKVKILSFVTVIFADIFFSQFERTME